MTKFRPLAGATLAALLLSLGGCSWFSSMFQETKTPLPGNRISVLTIDQPIAADKSLKTAEVKLPKPFDNPAWPDAGGYPNHAMYHLALGNTIERVWKADAGEGANDYGRVTAQPVVADGRVYTMDALDVVTAFDATNGRWLWRFDPEPKNALDVAYGGGVAVSGGRAYVTTGYGQALALDAATGKEIWRRDLAAPAHGAPTVADGRLFAITVENQLQVLDTADGHILWMHQGLPEPASLLGAASPAVEGDIVVVPYTSGELFGLRVENGRVLWSDNLATAQPLGALNSIADVRGQPVIDRDRVFAVSNSGLMVAINLRTGDRVWEQDIGGSHEPWVGGDYVYVVANTDELACLRREDGKAVWVRVLPRWEDPKKRKDALTWTGPVLAGDRLIVVSSDGEALSISPYTGDPLGSMEMPDDVFVSPTVADKTLYIITDEADLVALR
jgi:outer membrane protein assembly factor BamB